MRREHDCLGVMDLDSTVEYGIQTERARYNFAISGVAVSAYPEFLHMLLHIKKAAARANASIGALDMSIATGIVNACDALAKEDFAPHFPVDIFQGGGGTSINMNANEVVALRASMALSGSLSYEHVHPNTHVNMGQSTNDVIPSALRLSCVPLLNKLDTALALMERTLNHKAEEFKTTVKIARTCLQDALPITLGQEFSGYASFIRRMREPLPALRGEACVVTMGGTAVGTGLGTFEGYAEAFYPFLSEQLGEQVSMENNLYDGMQNGDFYISISAHLKKIATGISKIATDLRLLSSGPRAGIGELNLPAVQPGSSIMPGKINPVIPEMINQVAYQIMGNDMVISMAVEGGELDLNVWEPIILKNIRESFIILTNGIEKFATLCVQGISANTATLHKHAEQSLALSTVVAALFGYEEGVRVAQYAHDQNISVKKACLALGLLDEKQAEELLDPMTMTSAVAFQGLLRKYRTIGESCSQ